MATLKLMATIKQINIYNSSGLDFCHIKVHEKKNSKHLHYLNYDIDKKNQSKIRKKTWYYRGIANAREYSNEELVSYFSNIMS